MLALLAILLIAACMGFATPIRESVFAQELDNDECDIVFRRNVSKLYEGDENELIVSAEKEAVYDVDLQKLGFVYDFYANGRNGYAIVIGTNGQYEAIEFFFDAKNPYASVEKEEKRIYVTTMVYLSYKEETYFFLDKKTPVDDEILQKMKEIAFYADNTVLSDESETVYFSNRSETKHELAKRHPGLVEVSGLSNACAPIAGGNLIQFWDRYKTNLIENYTPGTPIGNFYQYKEKSSTTDSVVAQLYVDMGTSGSGTTISQFKNGISTYCTRKGYAATFISCMSGGAFSYTLAKQQLTAGRPLVLYLDTYTIAGINQSSGYDSITYKVGSGLHVMAGFGYKEVTYTFADGTVRQDKYIAVASGFNARKRGFFNINYNTQIDDAYALLVS